MTLSASLDLICKNEVRRSFRVRHYLIIITEDTYEVGDNEEYKLYAIICTLSFTLLPNHHALPTQILFRVRGHFLRLSSYGDNAERFLFGGKVE